LVADDEGLSGDTWVGLQAALEHGHPVALRAACAPVSAALRAPLRALLHYHLGHARLRTRQVMLDVQKLIDT
jgi:DNA repair protein RecO (recombination protein O)